MCSNLAVCGEVPDNVIGDKALVAALNAMAKGPGAREVDGMATRSMKPVLEDTRERLRAHRNYASKYPAIFPKQRSISSDHVDRGIVFRKDGRAAQGKRSYKIGATRRARSLLHLLEYGVAPHFQPNLLGGWMHPGHAPLPTMTPAFETGQAGVISAFGEEIADWLVEAGTRQRLRILRGR